MKNIISSSIFTSIMLVAHLTSFAITNIHNEVSLNLSDIDTAYVLILDVAETERTVSRRDFFKNFTEFKNKEKNSIYVISDPKDIKFIIDVLNLGEYRETLSFKTERYVEVIDIDSLDKEDVISYKPKNLINNCILIVFRKKDIYNLVWIGKNEYDIDSYRFELKSISNIIKDFVSRLFDGVNQHE